MPNENLLDLYSSVDPYSRLTQTATRASFTGSTSGDGQTYRVKTVGPKEYSSDFAENFDATLSSAGNAVYLCSPYALKDANGHFLRVVNKGDGTIFLRESIWNGTDTYTDYDSSYAGAVGTVYYYRIRRDESVGLHGTIYLYIYSNAARTAQYLLATLSLGLKKPYKFRYRYLTHNYAEAATGYSGTGYIENIERDAFTYSAPTYQFPPTMSNAEAVNNYTKSDPDNKLTVTATRVTAEPGFNHGHTSLRKATDYFPGCRIQFTICPTGNEGAGSYLAYLGISDEGGCIRDWLAGYHAGMYYDGTYYRVKIVDKETGKEKLSAPISAVNPTRCELRHHGRFIKCFIFSDSINGTWVDTAVLHGVRDDSRYSTIYAIVSQAADANALNGDLLNQPWDAELGFTITNTGSGVVEINPAGQAHSHPSANSTARYQKDIGALPSEYVVEVKQYYDALGAYGSGNFVGGNYRNGQHHVYWKVHTDKFGLNATASPSGLPDKWIDLSTSTATDYTLRLLISSTGDYVRVYRQTGTGEWEYLGIWWGLYVDTNYDGRVYTAQAVRGATGDCEVHEDYLKVATGLIEPPMMKHVYGYIEDIKIEKIQIDRFTYLGEGLPATVSHDGESFPGAGWTDSGGAGTTGEVSAVWKDKGTSSLHFIGASSGTVDRGISKTITPGTKSIFEAKYVGKIPTIADGHVCRLMAGETTSNGKKVGVGVYRNGDIYKWCFLTYDGATWVKTDSAHRASLNTVYTVQLGLVYDAGILEDCFMILVNGNLVAEMSATSWRPFNIDKVYLGGFGGEATYGANTERYIDSFYLRVDRYMKFGAIIRDSLGKIIVTGADTEKHIFDYTATVEIQESTDNAASFSLQKTIDTAGKQDFANNGGLARSGNSIYCFANRFDYTVPGENQRFTDVYKSSTGVANLAKVCDGGTGVNGINVNSSKLVENGKILCNYVFIPPYTDISQFVNAYTKMAWYDIATDTWDALGVQIAHGGDYANCFPSESTQFRRPSDGKLVVLTRWDDYAGGVDIRLQTRHISSDNGASFDTPFNLRRDWGDKAGAMAAAVVGDYVWFCGYNITYISDNEADQVFGNSRAQTFIMQCDPVTLEIINEYRWSYSTFHQDMGNGDLVASDPDETGGFYIHVCIHSGLSLNYYRFKVGNPLALPASFYYHNLMAA